MPESEQRLDVLGIVPAIAHEDTLAVVFVDDILTFALYAGILLLVEYGTVGHFHGEGERKFAGRIDVAAKHIGNGGASLATEEPGLHDGRNLVDPGHCNGVSGDVDVNQLFAACREGLDKLVLAIRKAVLGTVGTFAVLILVLVESAHHDDIVGILRSGNRIGHHTGRGPVLTEVELCGNTVLFTGGAAGITALEYNLGIGETGLDAIQRRNLILRLERR